jgi:hypothetical protein
VSPWDPIPDLEAAAALGDILRAAGYTEDAIIARLGADGPATDAEDVAVYARRLGDGELEDVLDHEIGRAHV